MAIALGAGCLQQNLPPNNTTQTCTAGSCPVPTISSFEQCAQAGYPVLESYPRQCRVPGGQTFTENLTMRCQQAGGHWNECSNRCQLDNQGNPDAICTLMCESLCECGGIAGFKCPEGYICKMPPGVPDALGYCIARGSENQTMTREQAYASARNGTCVLEGDLTENAYYNPNSRTWWIDLDPFAPNPLCNPACVIGEGGISEINPRCTGLIPEDSENATLTRERAYVLARNSVCAQEGNLTDNAYYNPNSRTWWIDLDPFTPNPLCNPACVISENGNAEVNGRCTGLIPPRDDEIINNITCEEPEGSGMTLRMALQIAGTGACAEAGSLTDPSRVQ
jgi:hypothetical protein